MKVYFNMKTKHSVETIDELDRDDFGSRKEYHAEKRRLLQEYQLSGHPIYLSPRSTKEWRLGHEM